MHSLPPQSLQLSTHFAFLTWDAALGRRMCPLATFGSRADAVLTSRLVCVDPPRADCEILTNASEVQGAVALVVRGGCSFAQKARRIQAAGAVAMILANNTREEPFAAFTMGESADEQDANTLQDTITIPCVMMCLFDVRQLFKQFPPSVKTGVIKIEVMDFETDPEAQIILEECKKQRELSIQNQEKSSDTSMNESGGGGRGGWWPLKRKTSSIMKLLEPQAPKPHIHDGNTNSPRVQIQGNGSAPPVQTGNTGEITVSCSSSSPHCFPALASTKKSQKDPSTAAATTKAPLFAFVQWSASAGSHQYHYAPLADFGLVGNNTIYEGKLVVCDPILADEATFRNATELSNAVALVKRGACTFPTKLERVQRCGSVAAIVGNDDTGNRDAAFVMSVDHIKVDHVTIPSVMVSLNIFEQLLDENVAFVRIICLSGEAAASLMLNAGNPISLMEIPAPRTALVIGSGGGAGGDNGKGVLQRFHEACRDGDHGACQRILDESCANDSERRELVKMGDFNRLIALHHACAGGNEHVVSLLIQLGALVDVADIAMQTPLHIACMHGHVSCVRSLVKAGAAQLAATGNLSALTMKRNIGGSTPLHYAAAAGSTDCLEVLLTVNARVNEDGKYLFDGVSLADNDGATPLHIACRSAHTDCAMYLIAANADLDATDNSGHTSLRICCEMVNDREFETASLHVIEKLVSAGACVRERNATTVTAEFSGAQSDALVLDSVESKALRRELEVMYLRHEAQRSQQRSSDLELKNSLLKNQLSELTTQVKQVVEQNLAIQAIEEKRSKSFEMQQSQIEQLHVQMKTIIQILHSHGGEGSLSPPSQLGVLPIASLYAPSQKSLTTLREEKEEDNNDEEELAQEAALARDLGKKFCREQKLAIAEMYFEKSLELFPLPGVQRLLEQVRKLRHEVEQRKSLEDASCGMTHTRVAQIVSKSKLIERFRATLSQSNAPERVLQSIEREVSKLVVLKEGSTEYEMARKWVEWLVMLPWGDPFSGLQNADFYLSNRDIFQQVNLMEQEEHNRHLQRAARAIQRAFREHYSVHMLNRSIALTRIQSAYRGHLARQRLQRRLHDRKRDAAVLGLGAHCSNDTNHGEERTKEAESSVDYSSILDPITRTKLRQFKNNAVVAGAHFVHESRDLNPRQLQCEGSKSPFHILQLVRASSTNKLSTTSALPNPEQSSPVYFVWSRWGDSTSNDTSCQCSLSGPYEELDTAQQRYERVFREQLQKKFIIAPPSLGTNWSSSVHNLAKVHSVHSSQSHKWSRDSPSSLSQLPALSA